MPTMFAKPTPLNKVTQLDIMIWPYSCQNNSLSMVLLQIVMGVIMGQVALLVVGFVTRNRTVQMAL